VITRKLTPAEQDEVARLMPYAAKIARNIRPGDEDMVAQAHLLLCEAAIACPLPDATDRRAWVGEFIRRQLSHYIEKEIKDSRHLNALNWVLDDVKADRSETQKEEEEKPPKPRRGRYVPLRPLGYTPFRPLTVHDVIVRLPAHLQPVALARWTTEKNRRKTWVTVAQELNLPVPECQALLKQARDLARVILNDEATSDVCIDIPDGGDPVDE
jgi:hypothetical protein